MHTAWLTKIFQLEKLVESGHGQRHEDHNLGLGHLYYALVRIYRPKIIVVIGSWRGFVPIVMAQACYDNMENAWVIFIDPSMVDDFWKDPKAVEHHFAGFGLANIEHHCMTTQEFVKTDAYKNLDKIGMLFVDGMHTAEQAEFDHASFPQLEGPALFHDSCSTIMSRIYGKPYQHTVRKYIQKLSDNGDFNVLNVPLGMGVAVVTLRGT